MVSAALESIPALLGVLDDWNRANSDNLKPIIQDIAEVSAERGKRIDLQRNDYVLLYETAHNEEAPELLYDFVTTRINMTVDVRTIHSRGRLRKLENEFRRLIHTKRKGDGENYDRLLFKSRTDLSDRTKRLFRMTFQFEIITFAEQIP